MECTDCQSFLSIHPSALDFSSSCPSTSGSCDACNTVNTIKSELEEALANLNKLIIDLQNSKTYMNHRHSLIVQKFPPEITSTIFDIVVSDCIDAHGTTQPQQDDVLPVPLQLIQVCQAWKQVAESTRRIWRYLSVDLELADNILRLEFIRKWISRGGSFPLSVYIYITQKIFDEPQDHFFPIIDVLAVSSSRWQNVSLRLPYATLSHLCQAAGKLPLVNFLKIEDIFASVFDEEEVPDVVFWEQDKPSPKSLFLAGIHSQVLNLDWNSITSLTAEHVTTHQCILLLRYAESLLVCRFEKIQIDHEHRPFDWINPPQATHRNLQELSYSSDCAHLLYCITLPNLRCFIYTNMEGVDDWDAIGGFFRRSNMPLEKLEMMNIELLYDKLYPLLSATPTIKHLRLTSDVISYVDENTPTPFLQFLAETANGDTESNEDRILPHLITLEFQMHNLNFPWADVPLIFGNLHKTTTNTSLNSPRPLSSFKVVDPRDPAKLTLEQKLERLIPIGTLEQLLQVRGAGGKIIYESKDGENLWVESIIASRIYES